MKPSEVDTPGRRAKEATKGEHVAWKGLGRVGGFVVLKSLRLRLLGPGSATDFSDHRVTQAQTHPMVLGTYGQ